MTEISQEQLAAAYTQALGAITSADLALLIPHLERFGLGGELDAVVRTARPGAKVQRRFLPAHAQADILRAALRTAKAQDLIADAIVGLYAEDLDEAVNDPSLAQLQSATEVVLGRVPASLVQFTLLGVVARQEVAAPHAIVVLRERFGLELAA